MNSREKKRRDKQRRLASLRARPRAGFDRLLEAIGILKDFHRLPKRVKEGVWRELVPALEIVVDASMEGGSHRQELKQHCKQAVNVRLVNDAEPQVTVQDFISGGLALLHSPSLSHASGRCQRELTERILALARDYCQRNEDNANSALFSMLDMIAFFHSPIDTRLVGYTLERGHPGHTRARFNVIFNSRKADMVRICVDGHERPAYRAGYACNGEIHWVSWTSADLGFPGPEQAYPVYVQSHALENLRRRVKVKAELGGDLTNLLLARALISPTIRKSQEGPYLVECPLLQFGRVGYFVARLVEDKILIQTFLFLTMQGTPESKLLRERLRLQRKDIEQLQLDRLDTFTHTDLGNDAELVRAFQECGCGHLLDLSQLATGQLSRTDAAGEIRAYLGMRGQPRKGSVIRLDVAG